MSESDDAESEGKVVLSEKVVPEISHLGLTRLEWDSPWDFLLNFKKRPTLKLAARSVLKCTQHPKR